MRDLLQSSFTEAMRICVAVPSITDFYFSPKRMSALGARTVVSLVERAGHTPIFFDFPSMTKRAKAIRRPRSLSHLEPYLLSETGPVSFFSGYKRLGPPPEACAKLLLEADPDLVLISSFAYAYAEDSLELAEAVRAVMPGVTVAVGGAGPSVLSAKYLASPAVGYTLSGEAEINLPLFLREFEKTDPDFTVVPGLGIGGSSAGPVSTTGRNTVEEELTWVCDTRTDRGSATRVTTSLSRGCPKRCSFCSNHLCHGRSFRRVPLAKVYQGLNELPHTARLHLNFEDDNLLYDSVYGLAVCDYVVKKVPTATFSMENGLDAGFLDTSLLNRLIDCGFHQFNLSLGSANSEVLNGQHRGSLNTRIRELTAEAAERGVQSITYFICGLPQDTPGTVAENLLFLARLPTKIGLSLYYPVPGLEGLENSAVFLSSSARLCCGSSAYPWTGSLSTAQMITSFRLSRFINLIKENGHRGSHHDLIDRTLRERRLYTYKKEGGGKRIAPVPDMDDSLARNVLGELASSNMGSC